MDRRVRPPRPAMAERAIAPDYALSSHVASLGTAFSMGSAMPEPYASGAFVGEHGDRRRSRGAEPPPQTAIAPAAQP